MTDGEINAVVAIGGTVMGGLQAMAIFMLNGLRKKLDDVCHRVYHHFHDDKGNVVIPSAE